MVVLPSTTTVEDREDSEVIDLRERVADLRQQVPGRATVSVVVPTLNEVDNIVLVLPRIPWWVDEVVLVDGGSTDGTVEAALSVRPDLHVVLDDTPGKGAALRAGWNAARGDIVVTIDADGSTDPAEIPSFIGPLLAGADMVKGSRFVHGAGSSDIDMLRRLGNRALTRLVRILYGGRFTDLCYGYNAFWRRVSPVFDAAGPLVTATSPRPATPAGSAPAGSARPPGAGGTVPAGSCAAPATRPRTCAGCSGRGSAPTRTTPPPRPSGRGGGPARS